MICGTVYGVVLNDRAEREALASAFEAPPYQAPPAAPVVYIKPRTCLRSGGSSVPVPAELSEVEAAPTVAILFGAAGRPAAAALAVDVSEPSGSYYRPAIRQRCRDGFLPVGRLFPFNEHDLATGEIVTSVDGVAVHRWSLDRLVRDIPTLIADLSAFMTLSDGDLLLVGLPGDAPRVRAGQLLRTELSGLPPLTAAFVTEDLA